VSLHAFLHRGSNHLPSNLGMYNAYTVVKHYC